MWQEYHSLQQLYGLGFDAPPFLVVRPLAANPGIDAVLVEEHVTGRTLGTVIGDAVWSNDEPALIRILEQMARFLAQLHDRSLHPTPTDGAPELGYLAKIARQLGERGVIEGGHQQWLLELGERWRVSGQLYTPTQALIHGDVTPANFLFTAEGHLVAIDLERMHLADRTVDLGCMAAELRHWFLHNQGSWERGERAIRFFYSRYQAALNLSEERMAEIHTRGRFFQGVYLLRIARNEWLDMPYRRRLVHEGEACLRR